MATKKTPMKKPAVGKKPVAATKIDAVLNKTSLLNFVSTKSGVETKSVRLVLTALEDAIASSVSKKGPGSFVLPGLMKITALKVAAKPKRKGINPFTGLEQTFAAKPATVKIKVRPLKKLKDAASA